MRAVSFVPSLSVVSNSLQPHGLQLNRLLCPWDSPGKNTGVGCQALLQGIFPSQGSNSCLLCILHWQLVALLLASPGKPLEHHRSLFLLEVEPQKVRLISMHLALGTDRLPEPCGARGPGTNQCTSSLNWSVGCKLANDHCNTMDCSPLGSSVRGILQASIVEWVAISFSRGSSRLRNLTRVSCIAGRFFLSNFLFGFPAWEIKCAHTVISKCGSCC